MKKVIVLLSLLLASLLFLGCVSNDSSDNGGVLIGVDEQGQTTVTPTGASETEPFYGRYSDDELGFSFEPPQGWEFYESSSGTLFFIEPTEKSEVHVFVKKYCWSQDAESTTQNSVENAEKNGKSIIHDKDNETFTDYFIYDLMYSGKVTLSEDILTTRQVWFTVCNSNEYNVKFEYETKNPNSNINMPEFEAMLNSLCLEDIGAC